jgi:prepilin-type processing-associated H-X9-DG protein
MIHYTAALGAWGTLFAVAAACFTGTMPQRWLAAVNPSHLLIERQLRRASALNLRFIGEGLRRYGAHHGRAPLKLDELVEQAKLSKGIVESPLGGRYVLTGLPMGGGRHAIVCRELDIPEGGGNVLYADGQVEWVQNP